MYSKEILSACAPTFEDIALENRKLLELLGILPNNRAVLHSLMQMMSCMGELSNLAYNNETSLSPFEQGEVRAVVGKMAVCLATFGEAFGINVGQAAMDTLADQFHRASNSTLGRSRAERKKFSCRRSLQGILQKRRERAMLKLGPIFFCHQRRIETSLGFWTNSLRTVEVTLRRPS
ncbi:hypothetical protein C4B63_24g323 [Trypanosoma cruzi]|uniref:Uncharacterized protein n=1 Tax=Trypanosoma cruzi TaxID=5693 RepID=A0A2V2VFF6_TRYCR|nr:hypothetical protein C4B63_24g323 [Trypanosoma cruzi]